MQIKQREHICTRRISLCQKLYHITSSKNIKPVTITNAWNDIHTRYTQAGVALNTYIMDNEISTEFIAVLTESDTEYQIVPPHTHRRDLEERTIQTFKNYFKAGLASVDPKFPLSEWDRLIEQINNHSTCSDWHVLIQNYQHTPICLDNLIFQQRH